MPKLVILPKLSAEQVEQIRQAAPGWDVFHEEDKEKRRAHLAEAEVIAGWNKMAQEECLKPESRLRWVQSWGAGSDKMPLGEFAEKGIVLTSASGVHPKQISESIFAMMLAFARKLHVSVRNQERRHWARAAEYGEMNEIHGRTAGIVGVGAIGEETARIAKAFGMKVLGFRRSGKPSEHVDRMYGSGELDKLLEQSDYVIVTLPLTNETRGMIGRDQFRRMKPSSVFINIGRGATTDTEALIEALREGRVAGVGLDVFEQEPLPESSPLWELPNVIITPHNSGDSIYYNERALEIFLPNLEAYVFSGRKPARNLVDPEKMY